MSRASIWRAIPDRIQSEVQRAIQRSIKGVEYIASSGPSLGSTPKDILAVRGTMNLYHYRPMADEIYRVPILIVMATTNRGYILDMVPGQSFIEFLLKRGYDVYMLDWSAPKPEEKSLRMEDYVLDFIPDCIRRVQQDSGETDVTVIGYCFGGVLSLLYGSIFNDGPMKNLICFTTPIDFREMKLFSNFSDRRYFDVDRLVDSIGNVPPEMILSSFEMLRPASRAASQVQLWENIWNDEYVKAYRMMDRWGTDTLPLAGEYFRAITKDLMWDNKLFNDTMSVGGRKADISRIKVPILHAVAEHDHIVPYDAAKHLIPKVGSTDKEEVILKGGHVSVVAGANAIKRLWPKLEFMVMREINMSSETRTYPRRVQTEAGEIEFRLMSQADEAAVLDFAQKLPVHDLLFLPRNISEPKVLSAWIKEIERGAITSILAVQGGQGGRMRHPGARSLVVVAACRRNPQRGLFGRARAGGRPGAVAGDVCPGPGRRPGEAGGADDRRSIRRHRDLRGPRFQGRGAAARPCEGQGRPEPRYRGARAQCGAGPGPVGSLWAAGGVSSTRQAAARFVRANCPILG